MKRVLMILVISLLCTFTVLANSKVNNLLGNTIYTTVYVNSGDTVWSIAAKHAAEKEDIRDVIAEIVKVNDLDKNARLYPGQALKVPVKSP